MDESDKLQPGILRELKDTEERIVRGELHPNNQLALMHEFLAQAKKALEFASGVLDLKEQRLPPEPKAESQPQLEPQTKKKKMSW